MILYLQKRCKLPPMMRSFAQFFIALFAYYVCLTRVRDHKHRLTDVAGGAVTGMAIGIFFVSSLTQPT
jgi:membrane-associated phospholipid phosphatase